MHGRKYRHSYDITLLYSIRSHRHARAKLRRYAANASVAGRIVSDKQRSITYRATEWKYKTTRALQTDFSSCTPVMQCRPRHPFVISAYHVRGGTRILADMRRSETLQRIRARETTERDKGREGKGTVSSYRLIPT